MSSNVSLVRRGAKAILGGVKYCLILLGASMVLFALVNIVALHMLEGLQDPLPDSVFNHVAPPESQIGISILQPLFDSASPDAALERARSAPGFEMHPGLHYMTARTDNKHYRIGLEGIRYDQGWDDKRVRGFLDSKSPVIFLMGGSTMMGHGVSGDETISWHLNRLLASGHGGTALNFGAQAYDQPREIEKLLYLLRAGYRPRHVVFLDGWNDVAGLGRSNLRPRDKVIFHGFAVNRGAIAFTPATRMSSVSPLRLLAEGLPIVRYVQARKQIGISIDTIRAARDPFVDGFDFAEADWMFFHASLYAQRHRVRLQAELLETYRRDLQFLQDLSRAFGFGLTVLLQPFGLLDERNPFVPADVRALEDYRHFADTNELLRREIAEGRLAMIDASGALASLPGGRYVDVAHYSPVANEQLARLIHRILMGTVSHPK